jgi:hypothetical protein
LRAAKTNRRRTRPAAGSVRKKREGLLGRDGEGIGRFGDRILTGDVLIRGVLGFFAGVRLVGAFCASTASSSDADSSRPPFFFFAAGSR